MDRPSPMPISLAVARALPLPPDRRSAEAFHDRDVEIRFAGRPSQGPQVPHERDEFYIVVSGSGRYRVEDRVVSVGPGDLLFAAARAPHGFEDITDDFSVWVVFYGAEK